MPYERILSDNELNNLNFAELLRYAERLGVIKDRLSFALTFENTRDLIYSIKREHKNLDDVYFKWEHE